MTVLNRLWPAVFLAAVLAAPTAGCVEIHSNGSDNSAVRVGDGESRDGDISTRNGAITIGTGATVDGNVSSRNGAISISSEARTGNVSSRNGAIRLDESVHAGSFDTRNGAIGIGVGSRIQGPVETRNGGVRVDRDSRLEDAIRTRNGGIRLGESVEVSGGLETRNGGIQTAAGSHLGGSVITRNGTIRLEETRVEGDVDSGGGDIHLSGTTGIEGDVMLLMAADWEPGRWQDPPRLIIESGVSVGGRILVDERAEVEVEDGASVPEIERLASRDAF